MEKIRDYLEAFGFGMLVLLAIVIASVVLIAPFWAFDMYSHSQKCDRLANLNEQLEFDFSIWTGCIVETPNGNWIHVSDMHLIETWE